MRLLVSQEWAVIREPLMFDSFNDVSWWIDVQSFLLHVTHCFAIEHIRFCYCEWHCLSACVCVCVFPHFSWLSFLFLTPCLMTMSVHLNQCAYLKCFKRLLSVLFIIRTTFTGTYTLANTQAGCGHTHLLTPKLECFLSHTHTRAHIFTQIYLFLGKYDEEDIKNMYKNYCLLFDNATHCSN